MQSDVIIIGGSFAGLSAALYLVRSRRFACVIDTGLPRNRFAAESHDVLAYGVSDILPDISGLVERWGKSIIHCPYCMDMNLAIRD